VRVLETWSQLPKWVMHESAGRTPEGMTVTLCGWTQPGSAGVSTWLPNLHQISLMEAGEVVLCEPCGVRPPGRHEKVATSRKG
jgi:hypothetical protein